MFGIVIEAQMQEGIQFLNHLIQFVQFTESSRAKEILAEILTDTHQMAFERGGWDWRGGADWEPTHEFWVKHLDDKAGKGPMVWTGEAQRTVHAVPTAQGADVLGPAYLEKFLPGSNHQFRETFPVRGEGENWVKMSEMEGGDRLMRRRIHVMEREIFAIFEKDAEDLMRHLLDESGFGEVLGYA